MKHCMNAMESTIIWNMVLTVSSFRGYLRKMTGISKTIHRELSPNFSTNQNFIKLWHQDGSVG